MSQFNQVRKIQTDLLRWYRSAKRDLPWRKSKDPYAIWISEIMLQQTQVDTVIPYFHKWLQKFPNVKILAAAREDEVLKTWEGLGYYSRARNLHRAAKEIMAKHNGKIPETKEDILSLPGIGRYTAGAILSIAFDQSVPLVDGNVIRVITRLFNIHANTQSSVTQKKIWDIASSLVPEKNAGDFNQALMELGATICVPGNPRCLICPLNGDCLSLKKSDPSRLPVRNPQSAIRNFKGWIFLIEKKGRFLIRKRPHGEVMGGLWEFPSTTESENGLGIAAQKKEVLGQIRAAFTKYRGIYRVVRLHTPATARPPLSRGDFKFPSKKRGGAEGDGVYWLGKKDLEKFTFSAPSRKVLAMMGWTD